VSFAEYLWSYFSFPLPFGGDGKCDSRGETVAADDVVGVEGGTDRAGEEVQEMEPTDRIGERVENLRSAGMTGGSLAAGVDGEVWIEAVVVILRVGLSGFGSCSCFGSAGAEAAGSGTFLYRV
jgi:hypothetical protein